MTTHFSHYQERGIHKRFYDDLKARDVDFDVHKEFNSPDLFVGMSLTLAARS